MYYQKKALAICLTGLNEEQILRAMERVEFFKSINGAIPYGIIRSAALKNKLKPMVIQKRSGIKSIKIKGGK